MLILINRFQMVWACLSYPSFGFFFRVRHRNVIQPRSATPVYLSFLPAGEKGRWWSWVLRLCHCHHPPVPPVRTHGEKFPSTSLHSLGTCQLAMFACSCKLYNQSWANVSMGHGTGEEREEREKGRFPSVFPWVHTLVSHPQCLTVYIQLGVFYCLVRVARQSTGPERAIEQIKAPAKNLLQASLQTNTGQRPIYDDSDDGYFPIFSSLCCLVCIPYRQPCIPIPRRKKRRTRLVCQPLLPETGWSLQKYIHSKTQGRWSSRNQ